MKGEIQPDHMPVNNFSLKVIGLLDLTAVTISGIDDELQTVDLPDRTVASGGNRAATEFDVGIPAHHTAEIAAMEAWYIESQDPITPTYKKPCTLIMNSLSGAKSRTYTLVGVFPKKRATPDLDMGADGDMAVITYTMSVDNIVPI